ncbi:adenine phosphoribosyltransferase [Candidatus Microgenomates bacterium]|nr:adenine phosphoribosyltransferase [Candidatus Microgenomates bacterium]
MKKVNLRDKIYDVPDFPQKGVIFRDLTPLLLDPKYLTATVSQMLEEVKNLEFDVVCGIDSRGFIFGPIIAYKRKVGFIPVRKINKLLPRKTVEETYKLEYGTDGVKIHVDDIKKGQRVLIVDDLVAFGGTAKATARLVEKAGGKVAAMLFLNELTYLNPREVLKGYKIISLIKF